MNKKEYKMPQILVMNVAVENHLCGGSPDPNSPYSGIDDNLVDGGNDPGSFSREDSYWD
ncbi:MAG: hypothetical protein IJ546_05010 [Prevotella sp.]|nr:hypothetical protein [Prevotella sp.]MBR1840319.1 hypothetical protein [Prevotella sp.]